MTRAILLAALATGCAHVSFTGARPDDVACGTVGPLAVTLRANSGTDCHAAIAKTTAAAAALGLPLRPAGIVFTGGYAGFDADHNMAAYTPRGKWYPPGTVVAQSMIGVDELAHELGHVYDYQHGLANKRDR